MSAAVTLAYAGDGPFLERMVSAHMTQNAMKNENAVISGMVSMVTKQHAANGAITASAGIKRFRRIIKNPAASASSAGSIIKKSSVRSAAVA